MLQCSLTVSGVTQLSANYISIGVPPEVITYSTPGITPAHLHTSLTSVGPTT